MVRSGKLQKYMASTMGPVHSIPKSISFMSSFFFMKTTNGYHSKAATYNLVLGFRINLSTLNGVMISTRGHISLP